MIKYSIFTNVRKYEKFWNQMNNKNNTRRNIYKILSIDYTNRVQIDTPNKYIHDQLVAWNFSDPIVKVNAVLRHFRQSWFLTRKNWQYMCENLNILEN